MSETISSLTKRHEAAVQRLIGRGISPRLIQELRDEYCESKQYLDGGRRELGAVERAEALERGEIDPLAKLLDGVELRAGDYK